MLHLTKVFPNGLHDLLLIDFDPFYQSVIPWGRSNRDVWNPSGSEQRLQHRVSCCVMSSRFPGILRMVEFEEPSWQLSLLIQKHSQSYYSAIVGHLIRWSSHVTCLYKLYLFFFPKRHLSIFCLMYKAYQSSALLFRLQTSMDMFILCKVGTSHCISVYFLAKFYNESIDYQ